MSRELTVALVGASGVVGSEFLRTMEESQLPVKELRLLATKRSAGQTRRFHGADLTIMETTPAAFDGADVAFISATTAASMELCPLARDRGAIAFDDSSAFRQEPGVPLVVPEVNPEDLRDHQGIIATPNCSTVPLVLALAPLMAQRRVLRVVADTYQSTSGAGTAAMAELHDQVSAIAGEQPVTIAHFPKQIAYNAIPQVDTFRDDGYTKEEWKMLVESRKILHQPGVAAERDLRADSHDGLARDRGARGFRRAAGAGGGANDVAGPAWADRAGRSAQWGLPNSVRLCGPGRRLRGSRAAGCVEPQRAGVLVRDGQPAQGRGVEHCADGGVDAGRRLSVGGCL